MLTPLGRHACSPRAAPPGSRPCFAWQYSAQIRDEIVRSGVRSLLQSISIFRMREMEDARSLAGLAMDVYSDRISVDHEDQQRLRFSADDITRLPVHPAINLWVADGTPRPGFVAQTLPDAGPLRPGSSPTTTSPPSATAAATARPTCPTPLGAQTLRRDAAGARAAPRPRAATATGTARGPPAGAPRPTDSTRRPERGVHDCHARGALSDAARQLPRRSTATTARPIEIDSRSDDPEPCALRQRDLAIVRDVWRYKFLATEQLHELWWPDASHPGGAPPRLTKLFHAGYLERFRPVSPPRLLPMDLPARPRRPQTAAGAPALIDPGARYKPRDVYDYSYVLHDLQLNSWVLAYRRLLGERPARLGRRDRHHPAPDRAPSPAAPRRQLERRRAARPAAAPRRARRRARDRPTTATAARALFLIEYDRTSRVDKNYEKFRRYDAFLTWWWRHTHLRRPRRAALRAVRLPGRGPPRQVPRRRRPRTHRPPLAPRRTPPTSTNTSAAAASSSATNATPTSAIPKRADCRLPARTPRPPRPDAEVRGVRLPVGFVLPPRGASSITGHKRSTHSRLKPAPR